VLLSASAILSLVIVEVAFRLLIRMHILAYPNPDLETAMHRYSTNNDLVYELKPSVSSQDGVVTTNKFGMRDYEYTLRKPTGVIRICVIGDSVAFGYREKPSMLPMRETFAKRLESRLNDAFAQPYEVLNFSVTGYNAAQEEIVLKEKVLEFEPDVVVVSYVPNDHTYTDGLGDLARQMSPDSLGSRLHSKVVSYLLHQYERRNAAKWANMNQVWSLFNQLEISSRRHGFEVIVLIAVRNVDIEREDAQHDLVNQTARSHGFMVFDLKEAWRDVPLEIRNTFYIDRQHFSAVGMQRVADILFAYFRFRRTGAEARTENY
jgi:lysophospholipase L1-like esterase